MFNREASQRFARGFRYGDATNEPRRPSSGRPLCHPALRVDDCSAGDDALFLDAEL